MGFQAEQCKGSVRCKQVFGERLRDNPACCTIHCKHIEDLCSPAGGAVYLSGIDMIHGTPVLDIKPYIADYDSPRSEEPLEDLNVQSNHRLLRPASQSDGTADSCDQRLPLGCGKAQHGRSTEEKQTCLEDRTPEENFTKSRDSTEIQHTSPEDRETVVDLVLESSRSDSVGMAEEQRGPQDLKSFLDEGTDRSRNMEHALGLQGSSAETRWPSCHARTTDRVPCSVVPTWVKEAPAPSLQVRFTPHAELDLKKLSPGGTLGYLGSPKPE